MPRPRTGSVYERRGAWFVSFRLAGGRPSIPLPVATGRETADARAEVLARVLDRLEAAKLLGGDVVDVPRLLRAIAARPDAALAAALREVEVLCTGRVVRTDATAAEILTVKQLGEAWTTGDLAKRYPDHVRGKDTADQDAGRLELYVYPLLGGLPVRALALDHALEVLRTLPGDLAPATRRHVAQLLNRLGTLAAFPLRLVASSPFPRGWMPKVDRRAQRVSEAMFPDEEERFLRCAKVPRWARLFCGVLAREGFRASEAARVRWRDVDLERGHLWLDKNKTDEPRDWTLDEGTARALRALHERAKPKDGAHVFLDAQGAPLLHKDGERDGAPHLVCSVSAADLRSWLLEAGVDRPQLHEESDVREPTGLHELRALFVTTAFVAGRSEAWIRQRTGHTTSEMLDRYRRRAASLAEGVARRRDLVALDDALDGPAPTPEAAKPEPPTGPSGRKVGGKVGRGGSPRGRSPRKSGDSRRFRRVDSNHDSRIQRARPHTLTDADPLHSSANREGDAGARGASDRPADLSPTIPDALLEVARGVAGLATFDALEVALAELSGGAR